MQLWNEIGAPYEAAIARISLAEAHHASGSEHRAVLESEAARTILDEIQAPPMVDATFVAEHHDASDEQPAGSFNMLRRERDYWSFIFEGHIVRARHQGMRYLARLLADPSREFHVLDLVAAETGNITQADGGQTTSLPRSAFGDAGEILDARANNAYRRRLTEIEDDIDQASATGATGHTERADAEHDFLVRELSRAVGLVVAIDEPHPRPNVPESL